MAANTTYTQSYKTRCVQIKFAAFQEFVSFDPNFRQVTFTMAEMPPGVKIERHPSCKVRALATLKPYYGIGDIFPDEKTAGPCKGAF